MSRKSQSPKGLSPRRGSASTACPGTPDGDFPLAGIMPLSNLKRMSISKRSDASPPSLGRGRGGGKGRNSSSTDLAPSKFSVLQKSGSSSSDAFARNVITVKYAKFREDSKDARREAKAVFKDFIKITRYRCIAEHCPSACGNHAAKDWGLESEAVQKERETKQITK